MLHRSLHILVLFVLGLTLVSLACSALSGGEETPSPPFPPQTPIPVVTKSLSIVQQLAIIDDALKQSMKASIAYSVPLNMKVDEAATVELLINPAISPEALATEVLQNEQVVNTSIEITPRMKAVLMSNAGAAFDIQPIHDTAEQIISGTETTKWSWLIRAKESGLHRLTIVVYRFVRFEDQDYWREVASYKADVVIEVTLAQRFKAFDWKWLVGIMIPLIGVPSLWSYISNRRKKRKKLAR